MFVRLVVIIDNNTVVFRDFLGDKTENVPKRTEQQELHKI